MNAIEMPITTPVLIVSIPEILIARIVGVYHSISPVVKFCRCKDSNYPEILPKSNLPSDVEESHVWVAKIDIVQIN